MHNGFYAGKRILVTGVAGVKGTWLALALIEAGAEVIGIDIQAPEPESNFCASDLGNRITFLRGDVADFAVIESLVSGVDGVFHLAATALVRDAHRRPLDAYRNNAFGVATVLEAVRQSSKPVRAVFVTTDKVYRPNDGVPWSETDPLVGTGAYAVSKACAEFIIADYHRHYFAASEHRLGIARAGNVVIGGDLHSSRNTDGAGRIFVDCYDALAQGRPPEIFSPSFTRPYTYGLDVISGYMTLMSQLHRPDVSGQAFNFGPYEQIGVSNSLLATKICETWGSGIMWRSGATREEPFVHQSLNCAKSARVLHWRPAYTLYEALLSTTRWYRAWAAQQGEIRAGSLYELNRELLIEHRNAARNLGIAWAESVTSPPLTDGCLPHATSQNAAAGAC